MKTLELIDALNKEANPERAVHSQRFFKTGKGQYGEGDLFLGLTVPQQRIIAKKYKSIPLDELQTVIESEYHEHRLTTLMILVDKFKSTKDEKLRKEIIDFYLKNTKHINNWDLVDTSARILGEYLLDKNRSTLYELAKSENLWQQRISIIATSYFIDHYQFEDTLKISELLLNNNHDLIHKAVGWMLREVGKKELNAEIVFLDKYHKVMPRTMLRYAIERFPKDLRVHYLRG